jgi:hypothetical protein
MYWSNTFFSAIPGPDVSIKLISLHANVGVGVIEGVIEIVGVTDGVIEIVGVTDGVIEIVGVTDGVTLGLGCGVVDPVAEQ